MIDRQLAHYRITAKLAAGGMGEVYRAEDTKLGRDVARTGDARQWLADLGGALDRRSVMAPWFIRVLWKAVGDPPKNYASEDFQPLPRDHPEVKAVLRRLW